MFSSLCRHGGDEGKNEGGDIDDRSRQGFS